MSVLYFFQGSALFLNDTIDAKAHNHHLIEIFISLKDILKIETNQGVFEGYNIIISPDEIHKIKSNENSYALLLLDSESLIAWQIKKKYFRNNLVEILNNSTFSELRDEIQKLFTYDCSIEEAKMIFDKIIFRLIEIEVIKSDEYDPRIKKAIEIINQLTEKKIKIKELAYSVCMSESSLIHLFTNQIGIPIRRYLLWRRLIDAINLINRGVSFTTASYETGFSDSAHLSRTFKKMFGLKLLDIFKNCQIVQVKIEK
ncbi:MAG TPA: AraC family transcriptional regulator [Spirochaetota bacterium]|nr:AraC family transcriptional regulator [Spirochaetota bacterium]